MPIKPYLLIDVDGVLNPDRRSSKHKRYTILGYIVNLNAEDGFRLLKLADFYDLIWATTWSELANEHIGPKIGLPDLPVIEWSDPYPTKREYPSYVMGKTKDIITFTNGRPFAWIDDDLDKADLIHLINLEIECLPLKINCRTGLTEKDFEQQKEFLKIQLSLTNLIGD